MSAWSSAIHGCHVFPDSAAMEHGENPQWLYTVVFDGPRAVGRGRRSDREGVDRCVRALSGAGVMSSTAAAARDGGRPEHSARRRRPGVPRALGGAGLRDGADAARARRVHLAGMGRDAWPPRSSARRPPAIPTPARPITSTGSPRWNGLVAEKGVADRRRRCTRYRDAWDHAADRTPHGKPIELRPEDFR